MIRTPKRSLLCTLMLSGLAACSGGDFAADQGAGATAASGASVSSLIAADTASTVAAKAANDSGTAGTWRRIGGEGDTVTAPAGSTVRYGANGAYVQKVVSGTFQATNAFFGNDPAYGVVKSVELFEPAAASTGSSASSAGTWGRIGGEWNTLTVAANTTVRYGANGVYVQKTVSGTFQATNAFFGRDPVPGVVKSVEAFTPAAADAGATPAAPSASWSRIGGEWDTVTVPAGSTVRYGANGSYVQKTVSGTFQATNAFFGRDPVPGVLKSVELLSSSGGGTGAGTGSNVVTPATPTAPTITTPSTDVTSPPPAATGRVLSVGPGKNFSRIADAAAAAKDGDTIEISAGTYYGDVATWTRNDLTIRGVGGRPVLDANGVSAQGKGIFVVSGKNVLIENIEFANAKVPDQNGAGIRFEGGSLVVRNAVFRNNEDSFITVPDEKATLEIYDSQFINNGFWYTGGQAHGIYINRIGRLTIQGSYFTGTQLGHLVKSRAKESRILYNRITDESGAASYQTDFPNGGRVYLIGNVIEKGTNPQNPSVVSFGMEGLVWPSNDLHAANNTVISRRSGYCKWVQAPSGASVQWVNNVTVGNNCSFAVPDGVQQSNNFAVTDNDFANAAGYDFRLRSGSVAVGKRVDAGSVSGLSLTPVREYRHVAGSAALAAQAANPGAFQANN